jgi:hypothetical protein
MAGPDFSSTPGRREFIDVILNRAVAVGCLIGTYERVVREPLTDGLAAGLTEVETA